VAADHHDLVRLHPRRGAADGFGGGRSRDAADARHSGLRGYARRHALRHFSDAGVLLCHSMVRGPARGGNIRTGCWSRLVRVLKPLPLAGGCVSSLARSHTRRCQYEEDRREWAIATTKMPLVSIRYITL